MLPPLSWQPLPANEEREGEHGALSDRAEGEGHDVGEALAREPNDQFGFLFLRSHLNIHPLALIPPHNCLIRDASSKGVCSRPRGNPFWTEPRGCPKAVSGF